MQTFYDSLYFFSLHIATAVFAPIKNDSFLFWPFLLSSVVIAILAFAYWHHQIPEITWHRFAKRFLSATLWWHPSARADYRLYFVNALLFPLLFGAVLFSQNDIVGWLNHQLGFHDVGDIAQSTSMIWKIGYTITFYLAYDFGRFIAHCLLHDVPILWEFHKVHHSATVLTPMTAFRAHPIDLLVMAWGGIAASGLLAWCFNHLAGGTVDAYYFMGLNALFWVSNLIGNLRHTSVWITYGPVLGNWLISPAHHQLHHSCEPLHIGCNRGFDIALWDRLYGTLYVPIGPEEDFELGLEKDSSNQWHSVRYMLLHPFIGAAKILLRNKPSHP